MKTIVSEKGQITIPKAIRDRLGLRQGTVLEIQEERGRLVARKKTVGDPTETVYGILKRKESSDQLVNLLRGPVEEN